MIDTSAKIIVKTHGFSSGNYRTVSEYQVHITNILKKINTTTNPKIIKKSKNDSLISRHHGRVSETQAHVTEL